MFHAVRNGCQQLPRRRFPWGIQTNRLWQVEGRTSFELKSWWRYTSTIEPVTSNEEIFKGAGIQLEKRDNGIGKKQYEKWPRIQKMENSVDVRKFRHKYHSLVRDATIENEEVSVRGMRQISKQSKDLGLRCPRETVVGPQNWV